LFNETCIDVGSLGRVLDELIALVVLLLLEESLSNTLVDNDQGDFWRSESLYFIICRFFVRSYLVFGLFLSFLLLEQSILFTYNLVKLVKLFIDDHLTHRITDTISIDKDVLGHRSIEIFVGLESSLEII
jgi:hypothetical protein